MKLLAIFRFELAYQVRRPWPWLAFAALAIFAFVNTRVGVVPVTLPQDFILNSPFIIATVTVFSCMIWLLTASAMAGEAAARDVHTGMYPLLYASPLGKAEYLGGRFLAALTLNALVLLGVQLGSLLAVHAGGVDPGIIGPFRPGAYLAAFALIALPNAFTATAIQFTSALLSGRSMASYLGSVILLFFTVPVPMLVYIGLGEPAIAKLLDPLGFIAIMNEMMTEWTLVEKNVRMFTLEGPMLWNRLLWLGVALVTLGVAYRRFRFGHRIPTSVPWRRLPRGRVVPAPDRTAAASGRMPARAPQVRQAYGLAIRGRQALAIAGSSFWMIAKSPAGLFMLAVYPAFLALVLFVESEQWGIPLVPRTGYVVTKHVMAPLAHVSDFRVMIPLLIVYFAGELVWRERDARLSENVDATSVSEWVLFLGKFLGLGLALSALLVVTTVVVALVQVAMGYHEFQAGLSLGLLFGLQLPEYLLFAMLAFAVHAAVNQKHVGLLLSLAAYLCLVFSPQLGVKHGLLVYGSGPGISYTDMRGFGAGLGPWVWFKLYWAAWALLLAVGVRLLWVRGRESGIGARLTVAGRRLTRPTIGAAALAVALILSLGGFIFYNTNVLDEYVTDDQLVQRRADYERRYGRFEGVPQPVRVATTLDVEIHPDRESATIRGSYRLVNRAAVPIDSVHVEPAFSVDTRVTFDRNFRQVAADRELGHDIYALDEPLLPGDSLTLSFDVGFEPRGFGKGGTTRAVVRNGTYFTSGALPVIGYQPLRELWSADHRRRHGLPRQVTLPPPGDIDPAVAAGAPATFEAVIGTSEGQVAVAPGRLRRTWSASGRRYFHYASDVPIGGEDVFFSADYAMHREQWKGVDLQVYVHPGHVKHVERLLRSVRASLDYYSAQFGPYPYPFLQIVEQPGNFFGMGVDGSGVVTGGEGFFMLNPDGDGFDVIFEVVAHEIGHQWWGMQLKPAFAEGGGVISESLAWYSAMQLVKHVKGREALRRFMSVMREPNPWPPIRTGLPLLRAMDPWANYRKGPYAMHALSEYLGEDRVNAALRTLVARKASSLATTLDMYRELQAVTPDSLRPLLHDLFEVNAFWTFDTKGAAAVPNADGTWQVTLDVEARKAVSDSASGETEVPVAEWIELGVFAAGEGRSLGEPLYLRKHRIRSGRQTIAVTVPRRPARGGIDPYNLLDWEEGDNIEAVTIAD